MGLKVGVDIGGTFTDVVAIDEGGVHTYKLLSTPHQPDEAVLKGVGELLGRLGRSLPEAQIVHGTTVGLNALLERKGARTALITTKGFEDILEIGRQTRPELYNLFVDKPPSLVSPDLRFGLEERVLHDGRVEKEVDAGEVERLADELLRLGVESAAICFLFSFLNPENELKVKEILRRRGVEAFASFEILPEYREYERMSTTVANAYVAPILARYLDRLEGVLGRVFVMSSAGGTISSRAARRMPIATIMSGPVGGVIGGSFFARKAGFGRVITFDMGGTSTDVSLYDGALRISTENEIGCVPIRTPMVEIHTVGAGGGSIAYVDEGGALRVGPQSAGADPGPACYGRGDEPTVTDANLILGRIPPEGLLGGEMPLQIDRAYKAVERLARKLGISVEETCEGIIEIANANMERAIRVVSVQRGYDPRRFALVSFGGAGGMHACELTSSISIPVVIIPREPGLTSAFGIAMADVARESSRTVLRRLEPGAMAELEGIFKSMERSLIEELRSDGFEGEIKLFRSMDMRYEGQSYELNVPFSPDPEKEFARAYARRFGHIHPNAPIEIVDLRVRAVIESEEVELEAIPEGNGSPSEAFLFERELFYRGKKMRVAFFDRGLLRAGDEIYGPAVAIEYSGTTFIPPGFKCRVDRYGDLIIGRA